jgi:hypothetical protein
MNADKMREDIRSRLYAGVLKQKVLKLRCGYSVLQFFDVSMDLAWRPLASIGGK